MAISVRLMDQGHKCLIAAEQDLRILRFLNDADKKDAMGPDMPDLAFTFPRTALPSS